MADRAWVGPTKRVIKAALTLVVLAFVARHVARTRRDLIERGLTLQLDYVWLSAATALYLLGLLAFGVFFWRVLARSATPVGLYPAVRAYLVSHLAKYVPGKAMVVVVRSGLVAASGARPATAAFATLYETLVMMAAGGWIAAAGFFYWGGWDGRNTPGVGHRRTLLASGLMVWQTTPLTARVVMPILAGDGVDVPFVGIALATGLGLLILVCPPVFSRLVGLVRVPFPVIGHDALPRFSGPLMLEGLLWSALGWGLLGLSQVAVIAGVYPPGMRLEPSFWPIILASVAFATVAGFAVPIAPGGLGVREWVLWTALASTLDRDSAVIAALVLRLVWVAGEVSAAAALILLRPGARRAVG